MTRGSNADFTGEGERQVKRYPVALECQHANALVGRGCFDWCQDCGAVRSSARPGQAAGPWHSCEACAL